MALPSHPARRGRPAAQDLPTRKAQLVAVAADVFSRQGYDQTSFAAIAREANVSVKTIYAWFDGKAGLFRAVTDHFASRIEPAARALLESDGPPQEALRRTATMAIEFALSPQLLAFQRAVIGASAENPAIGGEYNRNGPMRGYAVIGGYLERCHQRGALYVPDVPTAIDVFLGLIWGDALRMRLIDVAAPPLTSAEVTERARRGAALFIALHAPMGA
ncbi:TetR/AcrR family transcriptional regulator [Sphingomonas lenta]|uniref:TetR/AcrR family transcriptional regulator n=1 Tax=Sphingomonas lenta TaxID=1141887 RepID=UPI0015956432|nr:TetR/AcrR family transcriptional regulator [Sphingomonas lenta]